MDPVKYCSLKTVQAEMVKTDRGRQRRQYGSHRKRAKREMQNEER